MTPPDHTANTWRDLAGQLTAEQVARFERAEQLCRSKAHLAFPQNGLSEAIAHLLVGVLKEARWQARQNLKG
jgi:type VI protein secretion system component VasK